jgi:UDP-glucose 4-epimerase
LAKDRSVTEIVNFDVAEPKYPVCNPQYRWVKGDTRDTGLLSQIIAGATEVYDFAALLGTAELFGMIPAAVSTNVMGGVEVLEACRKHGVKRVCWASKVNAWTNVYSATKIAMEQIVEVYRERFGLRICVVSPWNLYGPRQKLTPVRKYFPTLAAQAICGADMTVYGSGYQLINVCHVEDAARATLGACRSGSIGYRAPVDLAGQTMTVNRVAEDIRRWAKSPSRIVNLKMREGEEEDSQLKPDPQRPSAGDLLGLKPTPWDKGGRKTLKWYRDLGREALAEAVIFHQRGGE